MLIACRECGAKVSDSAKACPTCGCPPPALATDRGQVRRWMCIAAGIILPPMLGFAMTLTACDDRQSAAFGAGLAVLIAWYAAAGIILPIIVGGRVGAAKQRYVMGALLGFFLGWVGVLIILLLPAGKRSAKQVMTAKLGHTPAMIPEWMRSLR